MPESTIKLDRAHMWLLLLVATILVTLFGWAFTTLWMRADRQRLENRTQEARIATLEGQMSAVLESIQHGE